MEKKAVSAILLTLLLTSMLTLAFNIQTVKAEPGTIYIRADGSIDPSTAPISSTDNVTYTVTGNINDSIVIERDDIILDGNGHAIQASAYTQAGIDLSWRINVTIENIYYVKGFRYGVLLNCSHDNLLMNNTVKDNSQAILLAKSSKNTITNNTITGNFGCMYWGKGAIHLDESDENVVANNTVVRNDYFSWSSGHVVAIGIYLNYSNSNDVSNNVVIGNAGICLWNSSQNTLLENTVISDGGITLYSYSSHNTIDNNTIADNSVGVSLRSFSSENTVVNNNITNNKVHGIYLADSQNNTFRENSLNGNKFGLTVESYRMSVIDYLHSIDTSNLIDTNPIYYLVDKHGLAVNPSTCPQVGYLALIGCTDILVENISLRNHYAGLTVVNTNNSRIINSSIVDNYLYGIYLLNSSANILSGNNITNSAYGLFSRGSLQNTISGSRITNNNYGIFLSYSDSNIASENLLVNKYVGIHVQGSSHNLFSRNIITNSSNSGILVTSYLYDISQPINNTVKDSYIADNGYGIETQSGNWYYGPVRNLTIVNNEVKNNTQGGIVLVQSYDGVIFGNILRDNGGSGGINIINGYRNMVSGNTVSNNTRYGIQSGGGSRNRLVDNTVVDGTYGIFLTSSSQNELSGNTMVGNTYNFGVEGTHEQLLNYVDSSNKVDGKPVYFWINEHDKVVPQNAGCVIIVDSTNITIKDVTLAKNQVGLFMAFSRNSTIENVESKNNYDGIRLINSQYNLLSDNIVSHNFNFGVDLSSSSGNTLTANDVTGNSNGLRLADSYSNTINENTVSTTINWYGILLTSSSNNVLSGNTISNNKNYGICIVSSTNNTLNGNLLSLNRYCLSVSGESLSNYLHSIGTSNLINSKPVYYWVNRENMNVPLNAGYVALVNCTSMTVRDETLTSNGQGVLLVYTNNSRIIGNDIASNLLGIYLYASYDNILMANNVADNENCGISFKSSSKNTIAGNNITNNSPYGVHLYSSYNNIFSDNTIANSSYYGIYLDSSSQNNIYHNNFVDNCKALPLKQANSVGTNVWDDGYPSGGNYWSDYRDVDNYSGPYGNETGSDGIGDRPYYTQGYPYGYAEQDRYPLMKSFVPAVVGINDETSYIESSLVETLHVKKAVLNTMAVSGDLNGTLDFTSFEIVSIATGSFANEGFSKGEWEAALEGASYKGDWRGAIFLKPSERKIYLKGAISGEISGVVEGYLTETVPGSGVYDRYQATWRITRVYTETTSATLSLNGTLTYQSGTEFPATELYVLQTSTEGAIFGDYNCSLSAVLTHVQVTGISPYNGEGFSIISYSSDIGAGEGWTYDCLASPGMVKLKGLFTSPLLGKVSATLDETTSPRSLLIYLERVDLGLPPTADLKVRAWGPGRASPGQTVTYAIELRNDGLKSAENITLVYLPPLLTDFVSASLPGNYDDVIHMVRWDFENIPPKTVKYLSIQVKILWGLPQDIMLAHSASIYTKERADEIFLHSSPKLTEKLKIVLDVVETAGLSQLPPAADALTYPLSILEFLGEEPLTPAILANHILANKAAIDFRFEEAEYRQNIANLLSNLQEDPEYLMKQDKSFRQAVEEIAANAGYTPPEGITQIAVARDPNIKYGPEGYVSASQTLNYTVKYENEGEGIAYSVYFTDILDSNLNDSSLQIGPVISKTNGSVIAGPGTYDPAARTITWLVGEVGPGEGGLANFSIKVRNDASLGTEIINFGTVYFPSVPETTRTNAIVSVVGHPNIAVTDVEPLELLVKKGSALCINVTVVNEGYLPETFNVTLYANKTIIQTKGVTLTGRSKDAIIFVWNTTEFPSGNYTISAYAWPVPCEVETADNLYFNGIVQVLPIPPPLSVSISPLSASILVGQSVTFASTVSGGYPQYSYQWYLNGAPVLGATSNTWAFAPTTSGIYYIYLKVTDAKSNTAQSETARIAVTAVPVGGYSFPIQVQTKTEPIITYIASLTIITMLFTRMRQKTKRKR
jgi:uncharacterized repeat protein (TIGR01451 family)